MITPDKIFAFIEFLERAVEIYENFSTAGEQIQAQRSQLQFIVLQRPVWLEYLNTPNFFRGLNQTQESLILEMMQTFGNDVRELERQLNQRQLDLATWWGMAEWYWRRGQDAQKIDSLFMTAERLNEIFSDRATLWMVTNMRDQIQQGGLGPGNGDDGNDSDGREYDYGSGSDSGHSSDGSDGDDSSHNTGHNIHRGDGADGNSRSNHRSTKTAESVNEEHEAVIVSHKLCQSLCSSRGFLLLVAQASSLEELWSYGCRTGPVEGSGVPYEVVSLAKDLVKASGKDSWTDYTVQQWLSMGSFYLAEAHQHFHAAPESPRLKGKAFGLLILAYWAVLCIYRHPQRPTSTSPVPAKQMEWQQQQRLIKVVQEALDICDFWFGVKPRQEIINDIRTCIRPSGETSEIDAGDLWRFRIAETVGDSAISPVPLLARRVLQGLRFCSVSKSLSEDQGKQICEKATVVLPRQDDHECYSDRPLVLACVCGKHLFRYYITEFTDVLAVRSVHVDVSRLKVPGGSTESIRICCEDEQHAQLVSTEIATAKCQLAKGRLDTHWKVTLSQTPRRLRVGCISFDSHPGPEDGDDLAIGCYQLALGTLSSRGALQLLSAPLSFQFTIPSGWEFKRDDGGPPAIAIRFKLNLSSVTLHLSFVGETDFEAFFRQYFYNQAFPLHSKTLNEQDFHQWCISNRALSLSDEDGGTSLLVLLRDGRSGFIFNTTHLESCLGFQLVESDRHEVIFLRPSPAGLEEFYIKRAIVYPLSDSKRPPTKPTGLTVRLLGEAERAAFRAAVDQGWIYIDGLSLRDACVTMHTKPARCTTSIHTKCPIFLEILKKQAERRKKIRLCIFEFSSGQLSTYTHKLAAKPIRIDSEMIELSKIRCEERGVRISLQLRFHTAEEARGVFEELIKPIE